MAEGFVVGSEPLIVGRIRDFDENGILQLRDLSSDTLVLKIEQDVAGAPTASLTATADPDQVANKGKYTAQAETTTFPAEGRYKFQMHITSGGRVQKTRRVFRPAEESL